MDNFTEQSFKSSFDNISFQMIDITTRLIALEKRTVSPYARIIDLTSIISQLNTDLFEVSNNGTLSQRETRLQLTTWMNNNVQITQAQVSGLSGSLAAKLDLAGGEITGNLQVDGNLNIPVVTGNNLVATDSSSNAVVASGVYAISISGNADTASVATDANYVTVAPNSTNLSFYPVFVASTSSGYQILQSNVSLSYNPFTHNLTATTFTGNLAGNATSATTSTSASNSINSANLATILNSATNADFSVPFFPSASNSNQAAYVNSSLTFNPASGLLSTPNLAITSLSHQQLIATGSSGQIIALGAGTTTTVLHGNASGFPSYGPVSLGPGGDVTGTLQFANGGCGFSSCSTGDLFCASGTNTPSTLAATATGKVLASAGVGIVPAYTASPTLTGLTLSGLTISKAVFTDGSNNLTSTGTLGFTQGGLGFTTASMGDLFYASATNTPGKLSDVATGSVLVSGGVGAVPAWSATPTLTSLTLPNAQAMIISTVTSNVLTITSASGGGNRADLVLARNDFTNGNCRGLYYTAGAPQWSNGLRGGNGDLQFFDEVNVIAQFRISQGSGTTSVGTFSGSVVTATNITATNGNLIIGNATKGLTLKSVAVSAGAANSNMVTGCVLVGGTVTITNTSITASYIGNPIRTTAAGTVGSLTVTTGSGTFTITSSNPLDTSTVAVQFILPN